MVTGLMWFTVSKEAKTEAQQFTELQRKLTQVVKDFKEVDHIKCLNNPVVIQHISNKLHIKECGDWYILKSLELCRDGKSEFEILSTFMKEE